MRSVDLKHHQSFPSCPCTSHLDKYLQKDAAHHFPFLFVPLSEKPTFLGSLPFWVEWGLGFLGEREFTTCLLHSEERKGRNKQENLRCIQQQRD